MCNCGQYPYEKGVLALRCATPNVHLNSAYVYVCMRKFMLVCIMMMLIPSSLTATLKQSVKYQEWIPPK